ncbi:hypothetical protein QOT17_011414 [Balamuthia mandrillaris]
MPDEEKQRIKAYDTLDHDILARTLHKRGAEEAAVGIILKWYRSLTSVIHMNGQLFEEFLVERGVMQGGELVCMDLIGKLPLIAKGY